MKSNSTLLNAILEEMAHPRTNYDILNDIDIPEFEIQQIGVSESNFGLSSYKQKQPNDEADESDFGLVN